MRNFLHHMTHSFSVITTLDNFVIIESSLVRFQHSVISNQRFTIDLCDRWAVFVSTFISVFFYDIWPCVYRLKNGGCEGRMVFSRAGEWSSGIRVSGWLQRSVSVTKSWSGGSVRGSKPRCMSAMLMWWSVHHYDGQTFGIILEQDLTTLECFSAISYC